MHHFLQYQCRGDLPLHLCKTCVSKLITSTASTYCTTNSSFRADSVGCSLLYTSTNVALQPDYKLLWSSNAESAMADTAYKTVRDSLLQNLASKAPADAHFFAASNLTTVQNVTVYALAQCFGFLNESECLRCLSAMKTLGVPSSLVNAEAGLVYYGSCFYQFTPTLFDLVTANTAAPANSPLPPPTPSLTQPATEDKKATVPVVVGVVLGCLLLVGVLIFVFSRYWKRKKLITLGKGGDLHGSSDLHSSLEGDLHLFSMVELRKATENFHEKNKLGQGGFGYVYKGVLENGQLVAIKKLTCASHHGESQFLAEVKFITTVQHRNLIRLYGCCIDPGERLLVYEFLPNQSLDKHIFNVDAESRRLLNWSKRHDILMGTARGLAYLHHDSYVRIIHRDIKAGNILLDKNFDPKIADFGLAKLFANDQTHVDTQIAGTLGYLAPEYALHGQLTEKADVYSYGVMMLEVVSGRKPVDTRLPPHQESLLEWAWTLYQGNRELELVDKALGGEYEAAEVVRVVQLALLCTQEVAATRPSMAKVLALLTKPTGGNGYDIAPHEPGFVPTSSSSNSSSTFSSSSHSLSSSEKIHRPFLHRAKYPPPSFSSHDALP